MIREGARPAGYRTAHVRRLAAIAVVSMMGALLLAALPTRAGATVSLDDWSMFGHSQGHSGVSPDIGPGASTAGGLTLKWKTFVGSNKGVFASPEVVYNSTLGEDLVYAATAGSPAFVMAINAATGAQVWKHRVAKAIRDSPAISGNTIYFGSHDHSLYALDATTGALICSYATTGMIESSPVVGDVDGSGPVVFFGDIGLGEFRNAGHEWAVNGVGNTHGQCTLKWSFNRFGVTDGGTRTGSWSSPGLAQDATGRWLDVFGSTNPDDSVYALDAVTGAKVWRFATSSGADADVGAGPDISAPGVNGIADGAVYIPGKSQIMYALDLATGTPIWRFNLKANAGSSAKSICTPARVGNNVICPYDTFVYDFNAVDGTLIWRSPAISAGVFVSSPAVSGAPADEVIFAGDTAGIEHAYSLATGAPLFSYAAPPAIVSSTAVASGMIFFGGMDGNEYALG
jgi:outer membrane protein assembly factor BamB